MIERSIALSLVVVMVVVTLPYRAGQAQATLQEQRVVPADICAGISGADASSCAQSALFNHNWPAFLKWAQKGAASGNHLPAFWLADVYETGEDTISKDLVRAYMWYDIAA